MPTLAQYQNGAYRLTATSSKSGIAISVGDPEHITTIALTKAQATELAQHIERALKLSGGRQ